MMRASDYLGENGVLANLLHRFSPRPEQQEMADEIAEAIKARQHLVCEAATGTGKTFAYLVPGLLSGAKVIVATGTKALQDQLIRDDYPVLREALGGAAQVAVLKGRANYLCHHRLNLVAAHGLPRKADHRALESIQRWATVTTSGDISEVGTVEETHSLWGQVTSTVDNCLGGQCPHYSKCYVLKARKRASEADLIVVNHHVLFADLVLREQGFGELLPHADAIIVDEAHQLPELASEFFGTSLSTHQLRLFTQDTFDAYRAAAGDTPEFAEHLNQLQQIIDSVCSFLPEHLSSTLGADQGRVAVQELAEPEPVQQVLAELGHALHQVKTDLGLLAERSVELAQCCERAEMLQKRLEAIRIPVQHETVTWIEWRAQGLAWHSSPLEVDQLFRERLNAQPAGWIFVSATLRVAEQFSFFTERLGLDDVSTRAWDSPFDYGKQALCYVPEGLPDPRSPAYTDALMEAILPVLKQTKGRAFLLFTSFRALTAAHNYLKACAVKPRFNFLVQGEKPRSELLRLFRCTPRAVLLGTSSFWQGVDVRGDALKCVVIDKLPFDPPNDPVLKARIDYLQAMGREPFTEYQVPKAVIALRQGVGRLIRDPSDRGVLVIGDPRLLRRGYGKTFVASLPPAPITRDLSDVISFLKVKVPVKSQD